MARMNSGVATLIGVMSVLALAAGCGDDDEGETPSASGGTAGSKSGQGGTNRGGVSNRGGSSGTGNRAGSVGETPQGGSGGAGGAGGEGGIGGSGGDGGALGGEGGIGGAIAGAGGEAGDLGGAGGSGGQADSVSVACTQCLTAKCADVVGFRTTQCSGSACNALEACYGTSPCDELDPRACYCGTIEFTDCFTSFAATLPNGPCKAQIVAALVPAFAPVDIPQVMAPFVLETTNPVGAVNQLAICQTRECAAVCN